MAQVLLDNGASILSKDYDGRLPLQYAACEGNVATVRYLLSATLLGIKGSARKRDTRMNELIVDAVNIACITGRAEIVKYLLEQSKVSSVKKEEEALRIAVGWGRRDVTEYCLKHYSFSSTALTSMRDRTFHSLEKYEKYPRNSMEDYEVCQVLVENSKKRSHQTKGRR